MFYLATIFHYLSGYLLAHFLQCFQFNTHMIESVYSNRVIAPDAETRMWKDARYININNIGLIIFWIKLISLFSSISKISLNKHFYFRYFQIGEFAENHPVGGGIYPTMANVNHSCDPNFIIINYLGRSAVAITDRRIEEGEEILDTYGSVYFHMDKSERQHYLQVLPSVFNFSF